MKYYHRFNIYTRLSEAQTMCLDYDDYKNSNLLNELYDLIQHEMEILEDFDNLTTIEKEQINNFSIYALKVSKNYKELLNYSLN